MRLSSNMIYDHNVAQFQQQQSNVFKLQQQIASGQRLLSPSDDPIAAAQAANVQASLARNEQFGVNRQAAQSALQRGEVAVRSLSDLLQETRATALRAANGSLGNSDRAAFATEVRSQLGALFNLANAQDENGDFIFAGYQADRPPFVQTSGGTQYVGDQGQRLLQVADARQVQVNVPGAQLFERIATGNGVFATGANAANTGSGVASSGSVTNAAALTGHNYQVTFNVVAGVTTYDIQNTTTATTVSSGNAYAAGQAIMFDGLQFQVQGAPANGDAFTVQPSSKQSLFKTLTDLANLLETPVGNDAERAQLRNGLNALVPQLDHAQNAVGGTLADLGANMREVERLQGLGEELNVQYNQNLSELRDVDYAQAVSDLTRQQAQLEAAQKSFARIASLSIFNFI